LEKRLVNQSIILRRIGKLKSGVMEDICVFCHPMYWFILDKHFKNQLEKFFWTGTETSNQWYGYLEGAVSSSIRVSKEVSRILSQNPKAKL